MKMGRASAVIRLAELHVPSPAHRLRQVALQRFDADQLWFADYEPIGGDLRKRFAHG
jgi:hypothetical protein